MEGCSNLGDDSLLNEIENGKGKVGLSFDLDFPIEECRFDKCKERLRSLFDQLLVAFMREKSVSKCIKPLPVLCGDGREIDLFKLFWVAWKLGGYNAISLKDLWSFVVNECGLSCRSIPWLKLIYIKYLNEFDQWLRQVFASRDLEDNENSVIKKLDLFSQELKTLDREQAQQNEAKNREDIKPDNIMTISAKKIVEKAIEKVHKSADNDDKKISFIENSDIRASAKKVVEKVICNMQDLSCKIAEDGGRFITQNDRDIVMSTGDVTMTALDSRKRKRESHSVSEMLNWLIDVAKRSDDPAIGKIPESSKWKDHGNEELWAQALLVRKMLLVTRHGDINTDESSVQQDQQKMLGMHLFTYQDENLYHRAPQKLRCSKRASLAKPLLCSCCNTPTVTKTKVASGRKTGVKNNANEPMAQDSQDPKSSAVPAEKQVSVGPRFQAQVPEWTGLTLMSDSKWLGTKMWAPQDDIAESDPTMKCFCRFPNSVECVRFHIAEKRFKLKLDLGLLFYYWRFDRMGEEVSLSWTEEEEKRFKDNLWNNASRILPTKSREKLVLYYFNVFLLRRRSYQNRVTLKDIDSDNDENECGCIGSSFGYQAVTVSGLKLPKCIENKESTDLV